MSELDPVPQPSNNPAKKTEREGLPPGYRMRADAHYVDQLTSRREGVHSDTPPRTRRTDTAEPPAERERREARDADVVRDLQASRDVQQLRDPHQSRDAQPVREPQQSPHAADWLLAQLLSEVTTIQSSAAVLAGESSVLARRANVDAISAHAWRAAFLLHAQAIVDGTHRTQIRTRPLSVLLARLRDGFAPECRLTALDLQVGAADWNATVAVDEAAMLTATTGAVLASIALLPDTTGAVIRVSAASHGGELRAVDVIQEEAPVPAGLSSRFFDAAWADRPGGPIAALGAACVKAVAALHGGEAAFMAGARRGSTIRINLAIKS